MIQRIYLTGYMTSGKSTIGPILANVLGWQFFDLDKVIENEQNQSVVDIFEDKGEEYFREIETATLIRLSKLDRVIISLGGGTISSNGNFKICKESGKIVYLKVSPEIIYRRIKHKIDRPLFRDLVLRENSEKDFLEKIHSHLSERSKYYEQADITINTDEVKIGLTVDKLAKQIKRIFNENN
jgi:shikimate kinase